MPTALAPAILASWPTNDPTGPLAAATTTVSLGAGLPIVDAFRNLAKRGAARVRPPAGRIAAALEKGDSLEDALERERAVFPSLFLSLARVGEHSGMLAEVFAELEKYYLRQRKLWRQFVAQSTWPIIQFVLAIFVLAGLILIMCMIAESRGGQALDPLLARQFVG